MLSHSDKINASDDCSIDSIDKESNAACGQQKPFQIVLVDIKRAAEEKEIHCVEKPLAGDEDLKFVALSYRMGDLEETIVDTRLGYMATVTSFDLGDFYKLCKRMTQEADLQEMKYVWVDAISVCHNNPARRKNTIYHTNEIYERANHIVAVPDLHLQYLKNANTKNNEIINSTLRNSQYIYHLIHGNTDRLVELDEQWLDGIGVPKDQALRQMLTKYTGHFVDGLIQYKVHGSNQSTEDTQNAMIDMHAYRCSDSLTTDDAIIKSSTYLEYLTSPHDPLNDKDNNLTTTNDSTIENLGNNEFAKTDWPYCVIKEIKKDGWKQRISERIECIRQSMNFLEDLIMDWSSRVWVINECNIAKKKNSQRMKYWFVQLQGQLVEHLDRIDFFEFNFGDLSLSRKQDNCIFTNESLHHALTTKSYFIYQKFRCTMLRQLNQQTFLEMMLKSKVSRNENRFYAILPLSEYKDVIPTRNIISEWGITGIVSVKLQLFKWMNTKDKLELLFLSCKPESQIMVLPTFATCRIEWATSNESAKLEDGIYPCNFDLADPLTIMLNKLDPCNGHAATTQDNTQYILNLKPCEYYICDHSIFALSTLEKNRLFCSILQLDDDKDRFDMVCIPSYVNPDMDFYRQDRDFKLRKVFLVGCFDKNKWVVSVSPDTTLVETLPKWTIHYTNNDSVGFNIY